MDTAYTGTDENTDIAVDNKVETDSALPEIIYNADKDFYKGMKGELRLKAEGLFKKAKEKGISIDEIDIVTLKENSAEFPGIGLVELPTYIAKIKGIELSTGREIIDAKQIDYYNMYQKYIALKIRNKNVQRDENNRTYIKTNPDLFLTEWERFEIGKTIIEDKEFGLEKTITGACDRVIRKLMGENDWLYPREAELLDEEFDDVQEKIRRNEEKRNETAFRKASERQVNYLKARVKNAGLDPDNEGVINKIIVESGFNNKKVDELSISEMSRIIDGLPEVIARVKN